MITNSTNNFLPKGGRVGNQVMRVMSLMGLSHKYQTPWCVPKWPYADYFENNIPAGTPRIDFTIREPHFHYCPDLLRAYDLNRTIDIDGYLQSHMYWTEILRFKKWMLDEQRRKYDFSKKPIAISVRRGDFVGHPFFFQVPGEYYTQALKHHFPDFEDRAVFVFSDDRPYCQDLFAWCENAIVVDEPPIDQLAIMNLCSDFIVSNSTFSFVGAYLAQRGRIIRPEKNFDNEFGARTCEIDFWPPGWEIFKPS